MQSVARGHSIEFGAGASPELIEVGLRIRGGFDPFGITSEGECGNLTLSVPKRCAVKSRRGIEGESEHGGVASCERVGLLEGAD